MNDYEKKCKLCKHNYQPSDCEPRCNCMCYDYSDFEPITNFDRIKRMGEEDLANELLNWFYNGYDDTFISDMYYKYDEILYWLREISEDE